MGMERNDGEILLRIPVVEETQPISKKLSGLHKVFTAIACVVLCHRVSARSAILVLRSPCIR
jgi:hypothetical protein